MIRIRPSRKYDADRLAPRLREADLREIEATSGKPPLKVLEMGIACSDPCYTLIKGDGKPCALFGVVPDPDVDDSGLVWLLASEDIVKDSVFILRNSRSWVEKLQRHYRVLWNYVDARNEIHIRWLKWCGFDFPRLIEDYGVEKRPFFQIEKIGH